MLFFFAVQMNGQVCSSTPPNMLTGGGFEVCPVPPGETRNAAFNVGSGCDPNWEAANGTPSICNSVNAFSTNGTVTVNAFEGENFACISNRLDAGAVCPETEVFFKGVNLCIGTRYRLEFHYTSLTLFGGGIITAALSNGLTNVPPSSVVPCFSPPQQIIASESVEDDDIIGEWHSASVEFVHSIAANNQLVFWGTGRGTFFNLGIDAVSLTCVESPIFPQFSTSNLCNLTYEFNGTATPNTSNVASWCWEFGDGSTGTGQNVTHTYKSEGEYTVCLTITDNCGGCSRRTCQNIKVKAKELATLSFQCSEDSGVPNDCRICTGSNAAVTLTANSNGNSYIWSTGATTQSITVSPTATQSYTVTVTGPEVCPNSGSVSVEVIADTAPLADFTFAINCQEVTFTSTSNAAGVMHTWDFGDGGSSTDANPVHLYPATGATYTVTHTVANACGADVDMQQVTINIPTVTLQVAENSGTPDNGVVCAGSNTTVTLTAVSNGGAYIWSTGATTASIYVIPDVITDYTVTVTVPGACTATASITIIVIPCAPEPEGCNCPGVAGVTNYEINGGTLSMLNLPSNIVNACIAIKGDLIVNRPWNVSNSTIIMSPGTEIVCSMTSNTQRFTLSKNYIIGCGQLWKGIRAVRGEMYVVNNYLIQDAEFAVNIDRGNRVSIAGNTFDKNYVSIFAAPLLSGQAPRQPLSFPVTNNKFLCTAPLAPHYRTGTLQDTRSLAGVFIQNMPRFNVGGSGTLFNGSYAGIIARFSNLSVTGATFGDLQETALEWRNASNTAIFAEDCIAVIARNNTMNDCRAGINVSRSALVAQNNTINITPLDRNVYTTTMGIWANFCSNKFLDIRNNRINTTDFGILINYNDIVSFIRDNVITLTKPDAFGNGLSIYGSRKLNVSRNTVQRAPGGPIGRVAFQLIENSDCDFIENRVFGSNIQGFSIGGGLNNLYTRNRVESGAEFGFGVGNSTGFFCGNITNTSYLGFGFWGSCMSSFRCNEMTTTGLYLSADAVIGEQEYAGNKWINSGAYHASSNQNTILLSQFKVEPPAPNWSTGAAGFVPWFMEDGLGSADCETCGGSRYPEPVAEPTDGQNPVSVQVKGTPSEKSIAQGELGTTAFRWMAQQQLYERLMAHPASITEVPEFGAFMANNSEETMGNLFYIRKRMEQREAEWKEEKAQLTDWYKTLNKKWGEWMALQEAEADEIALTIKMAEIAWYQEQIAAVETTMDNALEQQREILMSENGNIEVANILVEHEKTLNHLVLQHRLWKGERPATEVLEDIKAIADLCPATDGFAVYEARSWYNAFVPEQRWNREEECTQERESEERTTSVVSSTVRAIPNPANDRLTIVLPRTALTGQFELRDLTGKLWQTLTIAPGTTEVQTDVSGLPAGLYLYLYRQEGRVPHTGKIIVQH